MPVRLEDTFFSFGIYVNVILSRIRYRELSVFALRIISDKCDLPAGCKIQDYIVQENFDHKMVNILRLILYPNKLFLCEFDFVKFAYF